ncbi:hypothetical protein [Caldiplasma sukawensis]
MNLKLSLLEITAIMIVVILLGTGIQPATVQNSHVASDSEITLPGVKHLSNINNSNLMIERSIIRENKMVDAKQITENIDPYISIHLTYYILKTKPKCDLGIKESVYYKGAIFSSSFVSITNKKIEVLKLTSSFNITRAKISDTGGVGGRIHKENINFGKILCWTDEIGPNNAFILSFNQENTERLITYIGLPGTGGVAYVLTSLVRKASPLIAGLLGISADALETAFFYAFVALSITAAVLQFIDAMGGYQGIYFGVGYVTINLWFITVNVPYPLLNSNPAPGFEPIMNQCI